MGIAIFRDRFADIGDLFGPKGVVFVFGKLALIAAAFCALKFGDSLVDLEEFTIPEIQRDAPATGPGKTAAKLEAYDIISKRSLLGAPPAPTATIAPAPTKLKLRLVGTNVAGPQGSFAIIEDTAKNEQDVFDTNEMVFAQAKLIEVLPESVRLQYNDKIETLVLEEGSKTAEGAPAPVEGEQVEDDTNNDFAVSETELSEALSNLPLLLSQARAVPYFRNGQSIGMRLFAIRKDSMYEKLGLKNGDIITAVQDNSLSDPSQALKLFEQLKSERSINLKLERNGAERQFHYSIR